MSRLPATRRSGLFQASGAPAPHDGADHSRVKQVLFVRPLVKQRIIVKE